MMLFLVGSAFSLTLQEAVDRAVTVDANAVITQLQARQARLTAAEDWSVGGVTPSVAVSRTFVGGATADSTNFSVRSGVLDAPKWFAAAQASSQARAAHWVAEGGQLDAQYAVALLYFGVLSAEAAQAASIAGEEAAEGTLAAVNTRVAAGLDSELIVRRANAAALLARGRRAQADADLEVSKLQLARALQLDSLDGVSQPSELALPDAESASPYLAAADATVEAARLEHAREIARLFPVGSLSAGTPLSPTDWSVTLGATWTFEGVVGGVFRERSSALGVQIAEVQRDATRRDIALGIAVATKQARAAVAVAEAAAAREELASESLKVGQTRLAAGLTSAIEVLLLQDELAVARADRVASDFAAQSSILEARQLAGMPWGSGQH